MSSKGKLFSNISPNAWLVFRSIKKYSFSRYEDLRALDGGKDGLQLIEKIILLSSVILKPNSCLFLEIDPCHTFLLPPLLKEINEKILENRNKIVMKSITKDFQAINITLTEKLRDLC